MNAALKSSREFLSLPGENSGAFCVLGCVDANTVFWFVYTDFKTGWDFKGMADSFACAKSRLRRLRMARHLRMVCFGVSNRGESALLAHDFPLESLVCYTFCDR